MEALQREVDYLRETMDTKEKTMEKQRAASEVEKVTSRTEDVRSSACTVLSILTSVEVERFGRLPCSPRFLLERFGGLTMKVLFPLDCGG